MNSSGDVWRDELQRNGEVELPPLRLRPALLAVLCALLIPYGVDLWVDGHLAKGFLLVLIGSGFMSLGAYQAITGSARIRVTPEGVHAFGVSMAWADVTWVTEQSAGGRGVRHVILGCTRETKVALRQQMGRVASFTQRAHPDRFALPPVKAHARDLVVWFEELAREERRTTAVSGFVTDSKQSPQWAEWSRRLHEDGVVELKAGWRVIARVDAEGVLLPSRDLLVRWKHLGFAEGLDGICLGGVPSEFELWVSRPWWATQIAGSTGRARRRAERELSDGWAQPKVRFHTWKPSHVEAFSAWLSAEAIVRAPLPERLCVTQVSQGPVLDRDTNRPVPLDRLSISESLSTRLADWLRAAEAIPAAQRGDDGAYDGFLPEGRTLAEDLERETGRPSAVWADCGDVP